MTKQEILDYFSEIDFMYNHAGMHDDLSKMLDKLLELLDPLSLGVASEKPASYRIRQTICGMRKVMQQQPHYRRVAAYGRISCL